LLTKKKLSAGAVFKAGKAWLGPDVLAEQLERKRIREQREQEQHLSATRKGKMISGLNSRQGNK